jgi:uncharacterized protein YndB with AHSA1/START domain
MIKSNNKFTINLPIQKVWEGLTKPEIVAKYFFGTKLESTWIVGDPISFSGEFEGKKYLDKGIITKIDVPELLEYTYLSSWSSLTDSAENYKLVEYKLESDSEDQTILEITQEHEDQKAADESTLNWQNVIEGMIKILC